MDQLIRSILSEIHTDVSGMDMEDLVQETLEAAKLPGEYWENPLTLVQQCTWVEGKDYDYSCYKVRRSYWY